MKAPEKAALRIAWIALSLVSFMAASASAHHATATEYDITKTVVLKGTITRVDWANPHIHVYLGVKAERGPVQAWDVEFPSPGAAIVAGLSKQTLTSGVVLTFEGYLSRPDYRPNPRKNSTQDAHFAAPQHFACATGITLSNGDHFRFVVGI